MCSVVVTTSIWYLSHKCCTTNKNNSISSIWFYVELCPMVPPNSNFPSTKKIKRYAKHSMI